MTSSDAVTSVFHDSLCLSNILVKRIDLELCVSQNLKKMLCLVIHRVYKVFPAARRCACLVNTLTRHRET